MIFKYIITIFLIYSSMAFCAQPQYEYSWQTMIDQPQISPQKTLICSLKSNKTGSIYEQHIQYTRLLDQEDTIYYRRKKKEDGSNSSPIIFHLTSSTQETLLLEKIFYRAVPFFIKIESEKIGTVAIQEEIQTNPLFFNENDLPS